MSPQPRFLALAMAAFVAGLVLAIVGMLTLTGGGGRSLAVILLCAGFGVILLGSWIASLGRRSNGPGSSPSPRS